VVFSTKMHTDERTLTGRKDGPELQTMRNIVFPANRRRRGKPEAHVTKSKPAPASVVLYSPLWLKPPHSLSAFVVQQRWETPHFMHDEKSDIQ
jgi:hypothetical protein